MGRSKWSYVIKLSAHFMWGLMSCFFIFSSGDHQKIECGNSQIIKTRSIDIEYIEKMSCWFLKCCLHYQVMGNLVWSWKRFRTSSSKTSNCEYIIVNIQCKIIVYICRSHYTGFSTKDDDEATSQIGMNGCEENRIAKLKERQENRC